MLIIVDYGLGNLGSIRNMFKKIGVGAIVSGNPELVRQATALILPGVGAFDHGMQELHQRGLIPVLNELVLERRRPVLGICLGMQLLAHCSAEGKLPGLGWLNAEVVRFRFSEDNSSKLRIPHIGWNYVQPANDHPLFRGIEQPRFYFVHSYHFCCGEPGDCIGKTHYGFEFTSAVARDNVMGTQFHPEKSHRFGMSLLRNFLIHVEEKHVPATSHSLFVAQKRRAG
jgi:glutamine amidotransferase